MIYLTFDIEEFDSPFRHCQSLSFDEQMDISKKGTITILNKLQEHEVKATFFCTAIFAINAPELIERITSEGHEIASHGYYHNQFDPIHIRESKEALEQISGKRVKGFRMAYMVDCDPQKISEAGYEYDSSLNPTFIPGKYNNWSKPRTIFPENNIWQIPASVSPKLRIPLFWLSLHNLPMAYYTYLCQKTLKNDGYLNIYLHPWEFEELDSPEIDLPWYVKRNSGQKLLNRLDLLINIFKLQNVKFGMLKDCPRQFGKR